MHCHILPGIDDGPESFEEALAMARMAAADGIRTIVATPHMDDRYLYPEPDRLRDLTARLNELIRAEGLPLRILPGAEVRTGTELLDNLQAGKVMTVGDGGKYVLLELPPTGVAVYAGELFFRLQVAGYTPILAHAERVDQFRQEPKRLRDLRDRNVRVQVNAESISGKAGRIMRNFALHLVKEGLADILGSDGHNVDRRKPLLSVAQHNLRGRAGAFERLTQTTPRSFLPPSEACGREE
ncbi:MAG: CpsB/CapC family capsule biosynthesis tyrosine phosphatase [Armatimonadota bacterium]